MKSVQEIVELASAYYGSAVLFAAIDNGVFAAVAEGASLADVVAKTGGNERGMRLLLDACVAEGLLTKQGETYGMIKFGSSTELIVPRNVEICVKKGQTVVGGVTVVGRIKA